LTIIFIFYSYDEILNSFHYHLFLYNFVGLKPYSICFIWRNC